MNNTIKEPELSIHHCAISVPNIEETISWYKDRLGLSLMSRSMIKNTAIDIAIMQGNDFQLKIFSVPGAEPLPDDRREVFADIRTHGIKHFSFSVPNARDYVYKLEKNGVKIVRTSEGGKGFGYGAFIADNTGNLLEILDVNDKPISFHHVAVSVPNINETIDWYVKHFNFSIFTNPSEIPGYNVKGAHLQSPCFMLEIFSPEDFSPLPEKRKHPFTDINTHGVLYIALKLTNARSFVTTLAESGVKIVQSATTDGGYSAFIADNSGNLIEIIDSPNQPHSS